VFNAADSFVCVGCVMFMLWVFRTEWKAGKTGQKRETAVSAEAAAHAGDTADEAEK